MQVPVEITGHHVSLKKRDEALVQKRVDKLEKFYDRLTSCRVVITGPGSHQRSGRQYKVRIHLEVPKNDIVVDRQQETELTAAIHAAFDAATRKLQDYARTRRGDVKSRSVED